MPVSHGMRDVRTVMPKLYSGCILISIKSENQSDRSVWSLYTLPVVYC